MRTDLTPEEVRTEWVKALRSGKYKQGKHFLRRDDEYCCLGILCEVLEVDSKTEDGVAFFFVLDDKNSYTSDLPKEVSDFMNMSNLGRNINHQINSLSSLNDSLKLPFNDIADLIEKEDGYFQFLRQGQYFCEVKNSK